MSAPVDELASLREALEQERWDLAQALFTADYDAQQLDVRERVLAAITAATMFLGLRDECMSAAANRHDAKARRAAKRAAKAGAT